MSPPRKRADILLVERGLFESRARARAAIEAGLVIANDKTVQKPSEIFPTDAVLRAQPAHPYVSRGGVKLAGALERYPIDIEGHVCLDVGASTGGFTESIPRAASFATPPSTPRSVTTSKPSRPRSDARTSRCSPRRSPAATAMLNSSSAPAVVERLLIDHVGQRGDGAAMTGGMALY